MILKMHDLGFLWSTDLVKWTLLIVVQLRMASNVDLLSPEIIVPGTGHVEKLPHNLRPSLQETHSMMFDHRFPPRTGHRGHLSNKMRRHVILPSVLKKGSVIKRTSSTTSQRQVNVQPLVVNSRYQNKSTFMGSFIINSQFANSSSLETHSIISDVGQKVQSSVVHRSMASSNWKSRRSIIGTLHLLEDSGQVKGPRRERRNDESQTVTPSSANYNHSDSPLLPNDRSGNEPRGISDKEIVIIVVCSAIGLVICLLGAALLAKFFWKKMRDDNNGYHGVLQKETPEGLSPSEETSGMQTSQKESDGKVHTNVFAQIDEIDEDTCSLSPETKSRRLSSLKSVEDEGETKPLLTCSQTSPCNLRKADDIKNGSRLDPNEVLGIEKEGIMDGSEDVDSQDSTEIGTAEVCVEVVNHASHCTEPEPRIYCRTGLSQSDYSLSSFTSVNPSYRYGNQVGYMSGYYGYPSGDVTSPEVELDRDDVSLLPSQSFASSPLTFEVPVITSEDLSKEYRVSESQMVPVDDEDVTDLECPREFEDEEERLCNSVGKWLDTRSTAMDNESDYSIRVNVDEEDVADCGACEEEEEEEEGVAEASGEMSVGECTGDDLSQLSDGVGVSLATELVSKDTDGNKHQEDVKVTPAVEIIVVSECEKGPNDHFSSGDLISKENVSMLTKADHNSNHF